LDIFLDNYGRFRIRVVKWYDMREAPAKVWKFSFTSGKTSSKHKRGDQLKVVLEGH